MEGDQKLTYFYSNCCPPSVRFARYSFTFHPATLTLSRHISRICDFQKKNSLHGHNTSYDLSVPRTMEGKSNKKISTEFYQKQPPQQNPKKPPQGCCVCKADGLVVGKGFGIHGGGSQSLVKKMKHENAWRCSAGGRYGSKPGQGN